MDWSPNRARHFAGISDNEVEIYAETHGLFELIETASAALRVEGEVEAGSGGPLPPDWADLVRLHSIILERRVTTVLEIGVGYSTLVMAHGLAVNARKHGSRVKSELRRDNPFELHSIDDMAEYSEATERMLPDSLKPHVVFHHSNCRMATFGGRVCTLYEELPNICPDFVYLDGPSQFSVTGDVRGVSTRHPDKVPMSADLLAVEHFMLPGTLILIDGRTANARFLRANFQRTWSYAHSTEADIHVFELTEPPLGPYNRAQIEFSLGSEWLDGL